MGERRKLAGLVVGELAAPYRLQTSRMISSSAFPRAQPIAAAYCVLNICPRPSI
jgi:hypothetical protein